MNVDARLLYTIRRPRDGDIAIDALYNTPQAAWDAFLRAQGFDPTLKAPDRLRAARQAMQLQGVRVVCIQVSETGCLNHTGLE